MWKDKSEDGVRKMLMDNVIPLDRLLIETGACMLVQNIYDSKIGCLIKINYP